VAEWLAEYWPGVLGAAVGSAVIALAVWLKFSESQSPTPCSTKETDVADNQQKAGAAHAGPVGDPGTIWDHLTRLAAAIEAGDWMAAFTLAVDLMEHLKQPFQSAPPQPQAAVLSMAPAGGDRKAAVARQITDFVARNRAAAAGAGGATAGVPWGELWGLLLQALAVIFGKGQ
jgi:hypothetical protein